MPEPTAPTTETIQQALIDTKTNTGEFPGEFKLGDGTVVKASSWEEAFGKVAEMKANTSTALRDREEQIRVLQASQTAPPVAANLPAASTGFDEKKYWELANSDVRAATRYALAFDLGLDNPDQLPQLFNEIRNVSTHSADNMEIQNFMQRNTDFPGTEDAANLIIERLAARNAPLTADNLDYEYLKAVRSGEIEPLGEEIQRPFIPPNLGTGASLTREEQNIMQQMAQVPDDKLDEFMRKAGLLK